MRRWLAIGSVIVAVPALAQLAWMIWAIAHRVHYSYDLEWMEGGMLLHAQRLLDGQSLYPPPSVDFIPYLYTPLYPALLAGLAKFTGLGYGLGRWVSVGSLVFVATLMAHAVWQSGKKPICALAAVLALGFLAATYPWVEGWYDLVRGDTLFLALGVAGLFVIIKAPSQSGAALAAMLLALAFFAKQTGVLFVFAGGAALLFLNWRSLPIYTLVAGVLGGGGAWLLNHFTHGWFWTYAFLVHQQHDTNADRFWKSFGNILGKFPAMTAVVGIALCVAVFRRDLASKKAFLYWTWMFACACLMGALGWATQWAHFNAYIPAMTFGAIAAGCGLVVCAEAFEAGGAILAVGLAGQLWIARWSPIGLVPTAADRDAGDRLISALRGVEGDVLVPYHPFYAQLAGKRPFVHRMGVLDVTYAPPRSEHKKPLPLQARHVAGLAEAISGKRFAAIVVDRDPSQLYEFPGLTSAYRIDHPLRRNESPHSVSGAPTAPGFWLVPK